ncbi:hypothetical protein K431DRAFT_284007 [Polychaeton citri CBS 116435]|uniref:Helicase C-terminal domain-containing protein n=1 Tax=Polychaeton citri CBS 116435 TaxID=1314669 RepID=A0A9P4QCJ0_9PEZI|nr:hypothetical protein K431DRAFT_284007 [Polychaeton citri CBS 116435]
MLKWLRAAAGKQAQTDGTDNDQKTHVTDEDASYALLTSNVRKRKTRGDDGDESNTIVVGHDQHMRSHQPQSKPVKRRRVVKYVLVPAFPLKDYLEKTQPLPTPLVSSSGRNNLWQPPTSRGKPPHNSDTGRPRRNVAKRAYCSFADEHVDNECPLSTDFPHAISPTGTIMSDGDMSARTGSDFNIVEGDSDEDDYDDTADEESEDSGTADSEPESETSFTARNQKRKKSQPSSKVVHPTSNQQQSPSTKQTKAGSGQKQPSGRKQMLSLLQKSDGKGLDSRLPPLFKIDDIFNDMTDKALQLGLGDTVGSKAKRPLRVATMCSGTESPLLALEMIQHSLSRHNVEIRIDHLFSAEIVPYKQAYIERNFTPKIIFRDITELVEAVKEDVPKATTAYGAKVPVPTDVDIVIAGTSCVDFSRLNNKQKGLNDNGESAKTWEAVTAFNKAFRPAIVILENVLNADWDAMLACYEEMQYESAGVLVDTKHFYIPHTRQRGYMVCFDQSRQVNTEGMGKHWQALMEKFKRPASSPVTSFLETNDSANASHFKLALGDEPGREVDWTQCEITQMQYRQEKRLGTERPFTQWQESGAISVPENGVRAWYASQVERVLDTIDCAVLRKSRDVTKPRSTDIATEGYDSRFKTRIWDLSQNVYRFTDASAFGITSCITPSGIFYASDAARTVTPIENLKLQGLPIERITFTTETPSELQDLAGNAMSSTVVGSAILSALIAGFEVIDKKTGTEVARDDGVVGNVKPFSLMQDTTAFSVPSQTSLIKHRYEKGQVFPGDLLRKAVQAMRRCHCEGPIHIMERPLQQCSECHHTTCTVCGGNPAHVYRRPTTLQVDRLAPADFMDYVKANLPLCVKLSGSKELERMFHLHPKANPQYIRAALVSSNETFTFVRVRRTAIWTIEYQSRQGRLELTLSDTSAEWLLYAKADPGLASNHEVRRLLASPVGRCVALNSLMGDCWQFRLPNSQLTSTRAKIVGKGIRMPSWWARIGLPDYQDRQVWQQLEITTTAGTTSGLAAVAGTYAHLPKCGTACDSLYKRISDSKQSEEEQPLFLFLDPDRIGSPNEDQFVFSYNKSMLEYDEVRPVVARFEASWRPWKSGKLFSESCISTDGIWLDVSAIALEADERKVEVRVSMTLNNPDDTTCDTTLQLVGCSFQDSGLHDLATVGIQGRDLAFYHQYAWVLEIMRSNLALNTWHRLDSIGTCKCGYCAPPKPTLKWRLSADGQNVQPYEDAASAAAYERAVKTKPSPLVIQTHTKLGRRHISLGVNVASLGHRAISRLESHQSQFQQGVRISWTIDTGEPSGNFTFRPLKLKATTEVAATFDCPTGLKIDLFPQQKQALQWMQQQETGVSFQLEEAEEASIPQLRWRVEVRAQGHARVRGGICADHPGFGKTITSLALIGSEQQTLSLTELQERRDSTAPGLIAIRATLIVCPNSLMKQWQSEITEKLVNIQSSDILVLNNMTDIDRSTVTQFRSARIVLLNRALITNSNYTDRVAAFAGVPGPAVNTGRGFHKWMEFATLQFPDHINAWQGSGGGLKRLKEVVVSKYKQHMEDGKFNAIVPSKRLRGKAYITAQHNKRNTSKAEKTAALHANTNLLNIPLLEMFYFNRLIADEFHDSDTKEYAALRHIRADKRWGLSATPALNDMYEVSQMAELLDIPLRYGSDARGVMKTRNVRKLRKELTGFEQFDAMRQRTSDALHMRMYQIDQIFLDKFVRQNIMDLNVLSMEDHLVPVRLEVAHLALYTELSQHLNSQDMRIRKGKKSKTSDRDKSLADAIQGADTAEEALSRRAAFWERGNINLEDLIAHRECEAQSKAKELGSAIDGARNIKNYEIFAQWLNTRITLTSLGDQSTVSEIMAMVKTSGRSLNTATSRTNGKGQDKANSISPEERAKLAKCNTLATTLVVSRRSIRYLCNISRLQQGTIGCEHPQCHNAGTVRKAVSAYCGHAICEDCYRHLSDAHMGRCPAEGCHCAMHDYHLLWSNKISSAIKHVSGYGAKADAALRILTNIKQQKDQAILFVQYEDQLDYIAETLSAHKIKNIIVRESKDAGQRIADFQKSADTTVIVLNASSETAAGSNLQRANHVIFLSPLLRDTQYSYESTMAQAIGRVRRHGQTKLIHVYRIFALDTIDVDVLELRERRSSALTEQGHSAPKPPSIIKTGKGPKELPVERTQLLRDDEGVFSLRPRSWLAERIDDDGVAPNATTKNRVGGWEDFSSLVKFSRAFTEDDA